MRRRLIAPHGGPLFPSHSLAAKRHRQPIPFSPPSRPCLCLCAHPRSKSSPLDFLSTKKSPRSFFCPCHLSIDLTKAKSPSHLVTADLNDSLSILYFLSFLLSADPRRRRRSVPRIADCQPIQTHHDRLRPRPDSNPSPFPASIPFRHHVYRRTPPLNARFQGASCFYPLPIRLRLQTC